MSRGMAIRVVIVDDSPFTREVLRDALSRYPDIDVVGEACDGRRAKAMVAELRPDVVTMDVIMPMVGGLDAIKAIMAQCPTSIIVVSDLEADSDRMSMRAVEAGAIDTFAKPSTGFDRDAADRLADLIRTAAQVMVKRRPDVPVRNAKRSSYGVERPGDQPFDSSASSPPASNSGFVWQRVRRIEFVGIVASTGGPQTLRRLMARLAECPNSKSGTSGRSAPHLAPERCFPPMALVQHTSVGFAQPFTSWLAGVSGISIELAREGRRIPPGTIAVAPDDVHLEIRPGGIAHLHRGPKLASHRPSGTLLLRSLATSFGAHAAGVVLTGMGDDGADGALAIEQHQGVVFVEDPKTAILEGMPRATLKRTKKAIVAPVEEIGRLLLSESEGQGTR